MPRPVRVARLRRVTLMLVHSLPFPTEIEGAASSPPPPPGHTTARLIPSASWGAVQARRGGRQVPRWPVADSPASSKRPCSDRRLRKGNGGAARDRWRNALWWAQESQGSPASPSRGRGGESCGRGQRRARPCRAARQCLVAQTCRVHLLIRSAASDGVAALEEIDGRLSTDPGSKRAPRTEPGARRAEGLVYSAIRAHAGRL